MTEEKFDPRPLRDVMRESEAARLRQEYLNGKEIVITEPTGNGTPWVRAVRFNRGTAVIEFLGDGGRWLYEIDLEQAETADEVLAWLFHIGGKFWATPQVIGAVVKILREIVWEASGVPAESAYCHENRDEGFDWSGWFKQDKKERREANRRGE